jgi:hypothetical protein
MSTVRAIRHCYIESFFHWIYFSTEWTATLIKFLKDQLNRLQDFYHQSGGNVSGCAGGGSANAVVSGTSASTGVISSATGGSNAPGSGSSSSGPSAATPVASAVATSCTNIALNTNAGSNTVQPTAVSSTQIPANTSLPTMTEDQKLAQRQWQYCIQLAKYLYEVSETVYSGWHMSWPGRVGLIFIGALPWTLLPCGTQGLAPVPHFLPLSLFSMSVDTITIPTVSRVTEWDYRGSRSHPQNVEGTS